MSKTATKVDMPYLTAIDVGFGNTKIISNHLGEGIVLPSTVVPGRPIASRMFNLKGINVHKLVVTTEDGTFFVGEQAMQKNQGRSNRTQERDRANDVYSRVLFQTAIGLSVPNEEKEYNVFVVTGLPNADYELSIRDNMSKFLEQPYEITFHLGQRTITKKINVVGHEIMRQPEGSVTYNQFVYDDRFKETGELLMPHEDAKGFIGVIDIGHYTTDYALFEDGVIIDSETTCGSTIATEELYNKLRNKLTQYFSEMGYEYKATDKDLDQIVKTGKLYYAGDTHDMREILRQCVEEVAEIIAKDVIDSWGNETNRLEAIILTGGGPHIFAESMEKAFAKRKRQQFVVLENPQLGNVIGYYMFGTMVLTDQYKLEQVRNQYVVPVFGE